MHEAVTHDPQHLFYLAKTGDAQGIAELFGVGKIQIQIQIQADAVDG
jgi:hypothetical protein